MAGNACHPASMCKRVCGWEFVSSSPMCQPPEGSLRKNSNPSSFEWKNSKLRCTVLHLPLDQRIKTSVSPMDLAKFRLSKAHVHGRHAFIGHVPDDDDLEVMEIRSSPSSSLISTVAGGCTGRTGCPLGRTTGRNPKS